MSEQHYGAALSEWHHFAFMLGLSQDLLPVVSDPNIPISSTSKMKALGKTPSLIKGDGTAIGFADWTAHVTTPQEIKRWSRDSRLGICLQTRLVRAIDIDIDTDQAQEVRDAIASLVGYLPRRYRANSNKCLLVFELPGDYQKRIIRTTDGIVELLCSGQQFIAMGTHGSGVKYEWEGGLPEEIPTLSPEQLESLWKLLEQKFSASDAPTSTEARSTTDRRVVLAEAAQQDPVAQHLVDNGWVLSTERDGRLHIRCPFEAEHTSDSAESATSYFPANTGGYALGHFRCLHAHCEHRTDYEFQKGVGYSSLDFDDITDEPEVVPEVSTRFTPIHCSEFADLPTPTWIVKDVIPEADLGVMYGDSGSGKSFMALDIGMAIALGKPWRNNKVKQGPVAYIAAEGAGGFRKRLHAYQHQHQIDLKTLPIYVIAGVPNFLSRQDAIDVVSGLSTMPSPPALVIIDTWAQTTAGGNENSGEDMGKALKNALEIKRKLGAMVLLIHHSGKNVTAGARGWSGLRAAADVELEVLRSDEDRVMTVTKQKDGEEGQEFGFKLMVVPIGQDADGDVITSCVVEEHAVSHREQRAVVKLGGNERVVLQAARDSISLDGAMPDLNTVIETAVKNMVHDPARTKHDKRRQNATRALDNLVEKGILAQKDGLIYLISDTDQEDTEDS